MRSGVVNSALPPIRREQAEEQDEEQPLREVVIGLRARVDDLEKARPMRQDRAAPTLSEPKPVHEPVVGASTDDILYAEAEGEGDHVEAELPCNYFALVLARAHECDERGEMGWAVVWALKGMLLMVAEIACLWAVVLSTSFPGCTKMDDCNLGMVCARFAANFAESSAGDVSSEKGSCVDCYWHFVTPGDPVPKHHLMHGALEDDQLQHNGAGQPLFLNSTTAYCMDTLNGAAPEGLGPQFGNKTDYDLTFCMFAEQNLAKVTDLGWLIFYLVCGLLAGSCARERKQQVHNSELRRQFFPIVLPQPCCPQELGLWGRLRRVGAVVAALTLALTELLGDCVLLVVVPITMIVLLINTSMSATDTLLNGVAIAFVLEIDDFAVDFTLSFAQKTALGKKLEAMAKRGKPLPYALQNARANARAVMVFISLVVSIEVVKTVNCDRIWLAVARIAIRYALFTSAGVDTLLQLLWLLPRLRTATAQDYKALFLYGLKLVVYYLMGVYVYTMIRNTSMAIFYHGRHPKIGDEFISFQWNLNPFEHWGSPAYWPTKIGDPCGSYEESYYDECGGYGASYGNGA